MTEQNMTKLHFQLPTTPFRQQRNSKNKQAQGKLQGGWLSRKEFGEKREQCRRRTILNTEQHFLEKARGAFTEDVVECHGAVQDIPVSR